MRSIEAQYEAQEASRDDVINLAKGLQSSLFATRETIAEAYEYALSIIQTLPQQDQAGVVTAMQVLVNTIAEEIKRVTEV